MARTTLAQRIESDVRAGKFEDGFTREIAKRYGVVTATAHRALKKVADLFETDGAGLHCMGDIQGTGLDRGGVRGGIAHDYWSVWGEDL